VHVCVASRSRTDVQMGFARKCTSRSALESPLGMFSSRISTPRCRAKTVSSSSESKPLPGALVVLLPAHAQVLHQVAERDVLAISMARLISSTIRTRLDFTAR